MIDKNYKSEHKTENPPFLIGLPAGAAATVLT